MPLLRGIARTAVVAGTATAVSNRVSRRQANRWSQPEEPPSAQEQDAPAPVSPGRDPLDKLKKLGEAPVTGHPHRHRVRGTEGQDPGVVGDQAHGPDDPLAAGRLVRGAQHRPFHHDATGGRRKVTADLRSVGSSTPGGRSSGSANGRVEPSVPLPFLADHQEWPPIAVGSERPSNRPTGLPGLVLDVAQDVEPVALQHQAARVEDEVGAAFFNQPVEHRSYIGRGLVGEGAGQVHDDGVFAGVHPHLEVPLRTSTLRPDRPASVPIRIDRAWCPPK